MENNQYYYEAYYELIEYVDKKIKKLEKIHSDNLVCKKKCSSCCLDTSVLPIEFFSILNMLKQKNIVPEEENGNCIFLKKDLCTIYEMRPLICRTHGLPLAYGEDEDPLKRNISFCELNFTKEVPEFGPDNVLDMDEINIELVRLNENFIKTNDKDLPERMDMKDLLNYLK